MKKVILKAIFAMFDRAAFTRKLKEVLMKIKDNVINAFKIKLIDKLIDWNYYGWWRKYLEHVIKKCEERGEDWRPILIEHGVKNFDDKLDLARAWNYEEQFLENWKLKHPDFVCP